MPLMFKQSLPHTFENYKSTLSFDNFIDKLTREKSTQILFYKFGHQGEKLNEIINAHIFLLLKVFLHMKIKWKL